MDTTNKPKYGWVEGTVDKVVPKFPDQMSVVGPKHPLWVKRVEFEAAAILRYLTYLKRNGARPWFQIQPIQKKEYNFMVWKGHLTIPDRPDILFQTRILLNPEYPKIPPRCFAEQSISNYCGKLYLESQWKDPDENQVYIMICHDHMAEQDAWNANLGIAHFFIREVWFWWAAQQNFIMQEYDKKHKKN